MSKCGRLAEGKRAEKNESYMVEAEGENKRLRLACAPVAASRETLLVQMSTWLSKSVMTTSFGGPNLAAARPFAQNPNKTENTSERRALH